jgi:hypothetical protein
MWNNFIQRYKREKFVWNLWIIAFSLILALWINFLLLDNTSIWKSLKASILDVNQSENKSDLYLENTWNSIIVKNSKTIQDTISISLSLVYNPEILELREIITDLWNAYPLWEINVWSDIITIELSQAQDILENTKILEINYTRKEQASINLNMVNANFTDTNEENYHLTTSGIIF